VHAIKKKHNRLDILVNNAAVYHKPPSSVHQASASLPLYYKEVEEIIKTNYLGLRTVTEAFIPCMAPNSRIINIGSHLAQLSMFNPADPNSAQLVNSFSDPNLTPAMQDSLVKSYVASIKAGTWSTAAWPDCAYSVSKVAVNSITRLLQVLIVEASLFHN
jgi:NAD(P)-dependent dehydrogenase (short-subunit alcohol dehydrogenase family)